MLENLEEYKLEERKYGRYIPILDLDPERAAKSLTKKDLVASYNLLKEVFTEFKEGNRKHKPLYDTISHSNSNGLWFRTFLKEMEKCLQVKEKFKLPFGGRLKEHKFNEPIPHILQPFDVIEKDSEGYYKLRYKRLSTKGMSPINNYRLLYIMSRFDMSDFQDDIYPRWYVFHDTTLFEQYDERINKRVRVDFRDDKLMYFIAGASDNWKEIENVPDEMSYVISALIFRNI